MDADLLSTGSDGSQTKESLQLLLCLKCNVKYPNIHELLTHQGSEKHFVCNECKSCFWTQDGLQDHKRKNHRPDLDLECFGCHSHFDRAGEFWRHFESNRCKVIFPSDIARLRQKNLEFAKQLELRKLTLDDIIQREESHIKGDDTWASYSEGETTPTESVVTPDFPSRPVPISIANAHPLHYRSEDFPVLPIEHKVPTTPGFRGEQKGNVWSNRRAAVSQTSNSIPTSYNAVPPPASYGTSPINAYNNNIQKLVPNSNIRVVQAPANLAEGRPHGATSSGRIVDPDDPDYNSAVFYNEILEKALGQITGGIMDFHTRSGMFVIDKNSVQKLFDLRSQSLMGLEKKKMNDFDAYAPKQLEYWEDSEDSPW
ncbi:hypothetical protein F5B21DRAFT_499146 [Xylaria acuta]|nr:hypothetical protein F5B21DRAFT_499146 [Xylaria acuta]